MTGAPASTGDGAFDEQGAEVRFLPAPVPTPERMTAVLAQAHKATASVAENDLDAALAACLQLGLAGPHLAPPEPAARPPLTESAFGMHLQ